MQPENHTVAETFLQDKYLARYNIVMTHLKPSAPASSLLKSMDSLRVPAEFTAVFENSKASRVGAVSARAIRRGLGGGVRLGLIVPKKKTKSSALRNAFKRVARESVRALLGHDQSADGVDFVVQFSGLPEMSLSKFKIKARVELNEALRLALASVQRPSPKT